MDLVEVRPDLRLAVDRWDGDGGPPFVLVHGLASNARLWVGVAERLARAGHPVVALDQRGHGRSDKPDDGYDTATAAEDLRLLLEALDVAGPVVVGQSWGGHVAFALAVAHPELVRGAAAVDGGVTDFTERFRDWASCAAMLTPPRLDGMPVDDLRHDLRKFHPDWPDAGIDAVLASFDVLGDGTVRPCLTRERHMAIVRSMWDHPPSGLFARLQVPVVLVPADDGSEWTERRRREIARAEAAIPTVRVEWLAGEHDLHAQHPDKVAAILHEAVVQGFFR